MAETKIRNPIIDISKGIGILLVVWGHSGIEFFHYIIYMFHMPLFFLLSGTVHSSRKTPFQIIKRKTETLLKPYAIYFIILTLIDVFLLSLYNWSEVNPIRPHGSTGPLWFLICLFEVTILYACLIEYLNVRVVGVVSILIAFAGFIISVYKFSLVLFIGPALTVSIFYYLGFTLGNHIWKLKNMPVWQNFFVTIIFGISLLGLYILDYKILGFSCNDIYSNTLMPNWILFIISALTGCAFVISLAVFIEKHITRISKILIFIGNLSLYVFVFHLCVINTLHGIFSSDSFIINLIGFIMSVMVSLIIGYIVKNRLQIRNRICQRFL